LPFRAALHVPAQLHYSAFDRAIVGVFSVIQRSAIAITNEPLLSAAYKVISFELQSRLMIDRSRPEITANTPLRLADAVEIAFPMGGMTVAGLRRERNRNRLVVEKIAGKEFTTLAHIERMRELCRDEAKEPGFTLRPPAETSVERLPTKQPGSSETTAGTSAQAALQMKLRPRRES